MSDLVLFEEAARLLRERIPFALLTVVGSRGSTPRKAGAKMIVRGDRSTLGTIGGGKVELDAVEAARASIRKGSPVMLEVSLTEEEGHVCGGTLQIYVDPQGATAELIIVGAGHVGRALATAARFAGFRVTVMDERADYATKEAVPDADEVLLGESTAVLAQRPIGPATFIVIAAPDYESDFRAARAALKTAASYIGIVGSRRKREALFRELREEGRPEAELARVFIPVGLPIGGDSPEDIAVSIVAQMIQKRNQRGS